jgi:hypothetical protein
MLLLGATIIIISATNITLLQYYHTAQAFPCIGDHVKEHCIGYHDEQFRLIEISKPDRI